MTRGDRKMSRKKMLQGLVALGILAAINAPAYAMEEEIVSYGGYDLFKVQYFDEADSDDLPGDKNIWNEYTDATHSELDAQGLTYRYNDLLKRGVDGAFRQWAEILWRNGKNMQRPAQFAVGTSDMRGNAYADSLVKGKNAQNIVLSDVFQRELEVDDIDLYTYPWEQEDEAPLCAFGYIGIGMYMGAASEGYYGWTAEALNQQPQSEAGAPLQSTLFHEIGHALGIGTYSDESEGKKVMSDKAGDARNFQYYLYDARGIKARPGQIIVNPAAEVPADMSDDNENYFVVGENQTAYFDGSHVREVLQGTPFYQNNGNNAGNGIPILAWEKGKSGAFFLDLSHVHLARSLMSHHIYCSYNTFMEAELAMMQDLGYEIDRRNFFGRSIYFDDSTIRNTQGYFARNAAGTEYEAGKANTASLGIGLHVYGSCNNILQTDEGKGDGSADLLACGPGGAGIRIDGAGNTVSVDKGVTVSADGENGRGILVAYGNNNKVVIDGTVTAAGAGGDGVRFDFGSNGLGGSIEYRGSYLRYERKIDDDGIITSSENISLYDDSSDKDSYSIAAGDLEGPMGSLTVNGSLYGKNHAVYIAKNAFVDKIAVNDGARIAGDIVSDWKHFGNGLYDGGWGDNGKQEKLKIQYGTQEHDYDKYHKDLVTNLNFSGNTELAGNIIGSDNMKMTVNSGTLLHEGSADVVNVKVAEGAALLGKSYTVNDMSGRMAEGISDDTTGKFINHGTIGASNADSKLSIDGTLESDGKLLAYGGGSAGYIEVSDRAELGAGSTAEVLGGIAGEKVTILQAGQNLSAADGIGVEGKGLLNYSAAVAEGNGTLTTRAAAKDSLSGASDSQQRDYTAMNRNAAAVIGHQGAEGELRAFYAFVSDAKALEAINEIGTNSKEQGTAAVSAAQASTLNNRVLSSRLATAFGQAPATLSIGGASLDGGDSVRVTVPVLLPQEKDETAWIKFTKNWGSTAGDSNYTGSAITVGYDWKHGEQQRNGWFASYNDTSYGHIDGSENVQDTRIGYYTGLNKGADTQLFYADLGYLDGERSRLVSINSLGTHNMVQGNYHGWIAEIGGEWKHALHAPGTKTWQVSPYGAMQLSYMKNNGYQEQGSIMAYGVEGGHNTYAAAEAGMEFTRFLPKGSLNFRLGFRQALLGADYQEQDTSQLLERSYSKSSRMDRTHFVTSLAAETEFQPGWQLSTELGFQKGTHDKDIMASIQFRRLW